MRNSPLVKVLAAIVLGLIAGALAGPTSEIFGVAWVRVFNLIGQLFLNALTLVVVPLVVASIITGSARLGQDQSFAILGKRTLFFFVLTGLTAVLIGAVLALGISPGSAAMQKVVGSSALTELKLQTSGGLFDRVEQIFYNLVPSNVISAASQGQILGLILFCILFGFFSSRIESTLSKVIIDFWTGTFRIMMLMTHLVMRALPIGVFGLIAKVAATTGLEAVKSVGLFFVTVVLGLFLYMFLALPIFLRAIGKINPIHHFQAVLPALVTAFTTSSTAATLPVTIESMEKRALVPNRICGFVLPLASSINLTGTALYATIAVIFIAQSYGLEMNAATLTTILLMCVFTAFGMVAGVPSASIIAIVVILQSIGLPADGVVLILAVERILDMFRTTTNVFGNTCCAALVHRMEQREL